MGLKFECAVTIRVILEICQMSKSEYVIQGDLPGDLVSTEESRFDLLEEALQLVELGDEAETKDEQPEAVEGSSSGGGEMLHPAMRHMPHHPLAHYHNQVCL
ncbi:unnamed protein product [Pieris macdunnoughi]|uniref:Uncharacterized protein n=1 Tax=Pieris macdunnoughi TaxID=345717 RepID=A0A821XIE2_9NEOP|nr:unnamed protein product [Pieris macdunnoughi]